MNSQIHSAYMPQALFIWSKFVCFVVWPKTHNWLKKKRFENQKRPIQFRELGKKKPNGKRLADHYPWNYKIFDWDATRVKSILWTKRRLAGRAGQHVSQMLLSLSGHEMVIYFVLVKCDVDKAYLDPSNVLCFGAWINGEHERIIYSLFQQGGALARNTNKQNGLSNISCKKGKHTSDNTCFFGMFT